MLILGGLDRVLDGKFELDCPSMNWSDAGESLSGAGYIRQSIGGGFEFALFSTTPGDPADWFSREFGGASVPAGTLLPKDTGGELVATDVAGQEWTAVGLRPKRTVAHHQTVKGSARELRTIEQTPAGAPCLVEVRIAGRVQFPSNVPSNTTTSLGGRVVAMSVGPAAADVQLDGANLTARELTGGTSLVLASTVPLRPGAEVRVLDAVRFLENQPVPWCSLSRWEGGQASFRVRGDRYEPQPRFALPPLPEDEKDSYWRLASRLVDRPDETDSNLRLWIDVTATAAAWPLESRGLVTAIAVDAMSDLLLPGFAPKLAGYSMADEERARQVIEAAALPDRLARRLLGLLQGRGASATDRLFELARLGVATREEVEAWKGLRHPIAHGTLPAMGQELVDKVHRVRTLFSRLLFTAVGYDGPYRDYGSAGWPVRQHSCAAFKARGLEASPARPSPAAGASE